MSCKLCEHCKGIYATRYPFSLRSKTLRILEECGERGTTFLRLQRAIGSKNRSLHATLSRLRRDGRVRKVEAEGSGPPRWALTAKPT